MYLDHTSKPELQTPFMMNKNDLAAWDYVLALYQRRKLLALNFVVVAAITTIIVFLLPKWYQATAVVMPPKKDLGVLGLSSAIANLPLGGFDLLKGSEEAMTYMAILKSRTVREAVVNKFDLIRVYEEDDIEKTLKAFDDNIDLALEREGTITISILDKSPERAAGMANAFAEFLDSVNVELNIQKARNNRVFIEKRFTQNKEDMRRAEEEMRAFQERYGAIALPVQTEAAIKGAASLVAEIMATEVELGVKQKSLTPTHIQVIETKNKLLELNKKLNEMKYGSAPAPGATNGAAKSDHIFIPFTEVPEVGLEFARRYREVEVQKTLYQFLIQQYEQAKIQEAKDVPTIQILDRAVPPIHKTKPKRVLTILLVTLSATLLLVIFIFMVERFRILYEDDPQRYRMLSFLARRRQNPSLS
jgi:uncharacterized protein involved in exopolysaccharide biosynthesis